MKTTHKTVWAVRKPDGKILLDNPRNGILGWTESAAREHVARQMSDDWRVLRRTEITRTSDWQEANW